MASEITNNSTFLFSSVSKDPMMFLCERNPNAAGVFPSQRLIGAEKFPSGDVVNMSGSAVSIYTYIYIYIYLVGYESGFFAPMVCTNSQNFSLSLITSAYASTFVTRWLGRIGETAGCEDRDKGIPDSPINRDCVYGACFNYADQNYGGKRYVPSKLFSLLYISVTRSPWKKNKYFFLALGAD